MSQTGCIPFRVVAVDFGSKLRSTIKRSCRVAERRARERQKKSIDYQQYKASKNFPIREEKLSYRTIFTIT